MMCECDQDHALHAVACTTQTGCSLATTPILGQSNGSPHLEHSSTPNLQEGKDTQKEGYSRIIGRIRVKALQIANVTVQPFESRGVPQQEFLRDM